MKSIYAGRLPVGHLFQSMDLHCQQCRQPLDVIHLKGKTDICEPRFIRAFLAVAAPRRYDLGGAE